jgi:cytosine/adenosine deaminase-related metal-dependent hydrolase
MHCAEAPADRDIYHNAYGCSAMEFIRDNKLCGQPRGDDTDGLTHNLVLAHMVNLDLEVDLPLLSSTKTAVAHNPSSNLKLASGVAPIPAMLDVNDPSQITVGLGTDGAPCANHYDMIQEMHLAAILHKGVNNNAALVPAETALEMATINGARALGLEKDIGSLEVGKKADLVLLDPYGRGGISAAPWHWDDIGGVNPVTTVVHGCTGRDISLVMVDGQILVRNGELVDGGREKEKEIIQCAQTAIRGIRNRCKEAECPIEGRLNCGWTSI